MWFSKKRDNETQEKFEERRKLEERSKKAREIIEKSLVLNELQTQINKLSKEVYSYNRLLKRIKRDLEEFYGEKHED